MQSAVAAPALILGLLLTAFATSASAEPGFDTQYEREYNIFNPVNQFAPDNPLNPINKYQPDNPFNPVNQFDPDNPVNAINQFPCRSVEVVRWYSLGSLNQYR